VYSGVQVIVLQGNVLCPWAGKVQAAVTLLCASANTQPPPPPPQHTHRVTSQTTISLFIIFHSVRSPNPRIEIRRLHSICSEKARKGWESTVTYVRISEGEQMVCGLRTALLVELKHNTLVMCCGCARPDVHVHKNTPISCWPYVVQNLVNSNNSSTSSEAYLYPEHISDWREGTPQIHEQRTPATLVVYCSFRALWQLNILVTPTNEQFCVFFPLLSS